MAASVADQAQAVLDYQQWREEREGEYIDISASAYVDYLKTQDNLERLESIREIIERPVGDDAGLAAFSARYHDIREALG